MKEMKETISDDLSARYTDLELSEIIDKCSYLDPRFRTRYLNNKEETLIQNKSEALIIADDVYKEKPPEEDEPHLPRNWKDCGQFWQR